MHNILFSRAEIGQESLEWRPCWLYHCLRLRSCPRGWQTSPLAQRWEGKERRVFNLTFIQLIQSFDYSSIFSYDDHKEQKQFKSVFKFEDLPRTNYEADYFKVINQNLFLNLNFQNLAVFVVFTHLCQFTKSMFEIGFWTLFKCVI